MPVHSHFDLYLAKAFDSIPHERLLLKLNSNDIDGCLLNWLRHFLTGYKQRVASLEELALNGQSSVTSGTPQGTILGPILFLLYINDITECVSSTIKLYADDSKIYREIVDSITDSSASPSGPAHRPIAVNGLINGSYVLMQISTNSRVITHSRDKSVTIYTLGKTLKDVHSFNALGVRIIKDLS